MLALDALDPVWNRARRLQAARLVGTSFLNLDSTWQTSLFDSKHPAPRPRGLH